jgi:hypothetical protein
MSKKKLNQKIIDQIVNLRKTGHSIPEIRKATSKGSATIFKYIQGVSVLPEYQNVLKSKQGGSKERSRKNWINAREASEKLVNVLTSKEKILILASLYWAEGNKKDFNIINSDPELIRVAVECLEDVGVNKDELSFSLRLYADLNRDEATAYWVSHLGIKKVQIVGVEIIEGKEKGKLIFGMCRVRIKKGGHHFKFIMSVIDRIKKIV